MNQHCRFVEDAGPFAGTTVEVWNSFVDGIQYSINGQNMGRLTNADRLLLSPKTLPPQAYSNFCMALLNDYKASQPYIDSRSILLL